MGAGDYYGGAGAPVTYGGDADPAAAGLEGLTDAALRRRVARCPRHGGAWSYRCPACRAVVDELDRREAADGR